MGTSAEALARALAWLVSDVSLKPDEWAREQDMMASAVETFAGAEAKTYEDVGVGTTKNGLVIELPNGQQYAIIIEPIQLGRTI